jgi:hypothetical protein
MEDFETLSEKLARVMNECDRLRGENARLRELLNQQTEHSKDPLIVAGKVGPELTQGSPERTPLRNESVAPELSVAGKVALFRSLFRGRDDVYAIRWESETGKSGYSPASIRDWDALRLIPKSEWKKKDKETRQLLPLTDAAVHNHLAGKTTIGVYPLLPDETCWFLPWILTRTRGKKMLLHSSIRAASGTFRPRWSALDPATERTSGFSSQLRLRQCWQESWAQRS